MKVHLMKEIEKFAKQLINDELSQNTIYSYICGVKFYFENFDEINKENLIKFKKSLLSRNFKPKTINSKIIAINRYLQFIGREDLKIKMLKIQNELSFENVISYHDYLFFLNKLKKDKNYMWYFLVRFLGATGARVSELIQIKVEHIIVGYADLYTKGGKIRRIYIPKKLKKDILEWLNKINKTSGYLFINRFGNRITARGIAHQLKKYANDYGMELKCIHPHSFRHMFAKKFLEETGNIALLSNLLGHDSIATTEIYLRMSKNEQQSKVNEVVNW